MISDVHVFIYIPKVREEWHKKIALLSEMTLAFVEGTAASGTNNATLQVHAWSKS